MYRRRLAYFLSLAITAGSLAVPTITYADTPTTIVLGEGTATVTGPHASIENKEGYAIVTIDGSTAGDPVKISGEGSEVYFKLIHGENIEFQEDTTLVNTRDIDTITSDSGSEVLQTIKALGDVSVTCKKNFVKSTAQVTFGDEDGEDTKGEIAITDTDGETCLDISSTISFGNTGVNITGGSVLASNESNIVFEAGSEVTIIDSPTDAITCENVTFDDGEVSIINARGRGMKIGRSFSMTAGSLDISTLCEQADKAYWKAEKPTTTPDTNFNYIWKESNVLYEKKNVDLGTYTGIELEQFDIDGGEITIDTTATGLKTNTVFNPVVTYAGTTTPYTVPKSADVPYILGAPADGIKTNTAEFRGGVVTIAAAGNGVTSAINCDVTKEAAELSITQAYKGIKASTVKLPHGDISIASCDDGIEASKEGVMTVGNETSYHALNTGNVTISGNTILEIVIDKSDKSRKIGSTTYTYGSVGSAIDSKGSISVNGGEILLCNDSSEIAETFDYRDSFIYKDGSFLSVGCSTNSLPTKNMKPYAYQLGNYAKDSQLSIKEGLSSLLSKKLKTSGTVIIYSDGELNDNGVYTCNSKEMVTVSANSDKPTPKPPVDPDPDPSPSPSPSPDPDPTPDPDPDPDPDPSPSPSPSPTVKKEHYNISNGTSDPNVKSVMCISGDKVVTKAVEGTPVKVVAYTVSGTEVKDITVVMPTRSVILSNAQTFVMPSGNVVVVARATEPDGGDDPEPTPPIDGLWYVDGEGTVVYVKTGVKLYANGNLYVPGYGTLLYQSAQLMDDGSIKYANGLIYKVNGDIVTPLGVTMHPDGTTDSQPAPKPKPAPDGKYTVSSDGSVVTPDGTVIPASEIKHNPDGTLTLPNGIVLNPDGSIYVRPVTPSNNTVSGTSLPGGYTVTYQHVVSYNGMKHVATNMNETKTKNPDMEIVVRNSEGEVLEYGSDYKLKFKDNKNCKSKKGSRFYVILLHDKANKKAVKKEAIKFTITPYDITGKEIFAEVCEKKNNGFIVKKATLTENGGKLRYSKKKTKKCDLYGGKYRDKAKTSISINGANNLTGTGFMYVTD